VSRVLEVENLRVTFPGPNGQRVAAVDGVNFVLHRGETLALVGESGCGKSLTSLSLLRLVPAPGRIEPESRIRLGSTSVLALEGDALREIRGRRIGMIFQDPMTSLDPVFRVGDQIAEGILAHFSISKRDARDRAVALLREVGIPDPAARAQAYPHQLSGGMRQRVMIAIALAAEPEILVADEPTTALDVTVQAQILEVLDRLRVQRGMAVLLITHDLGIVAGRADRVAVMYGGEIVEEANVKTLFAEAHHPYTEGLLAAMPRMGESRDRLQTIPGTVPPPTRWPEGCRFHDRCPYAWERCTREHPPLYQIGGGHVSRCHLAEEPERRAHPHEPLVMQRSSRA
jgi:oligopeptide/dipeptide ABC transporter ATP-binding protein